MPRRDQLLLGLHERASAELGAGHFELIEQTPLDALAPLAEALTLAGHGNIVTYSRKVFIPLTQLCRDVCHYCTFARAPRSLAAPYLDPQAALAIARQGVATGCREALFTLGDRPEDRYAIARQWLADRGHSSTLAYLESVARLVFEETGLLPHLNPGNMNAGEMARLRTCSVSMGLMLENAADRLSARGGPHWGSPDKVPAMRLATIRTAGELAIPFTSGILIGIGETRRERLEAILALRALHERHGHIQEIIIQNFRAKPRTRMAQAPEPSLDEHLWTIAAARLLLGPNMSIQAPPNLQPDHLEKLLRAGVNDWGGVSPATIDHVNPEAPWPQLDALETRTGDTGRHLTQRLAIGPAFAGAPERWLDARFHTAVQRGSDSSGLARTCRWTAGSGMPPPIEEPRRLPRPGGLPAPVEAIVARARRGEALGESDIVGLFSLRGDGLDALFRAADALRDEVVGSAVTYVVNRNLNYTNICLYRCGFCAFSKGSVRSARGAAYRLDLDDIAARVTEAADAGATEVCLQGGIHPSYTGTTYLSILEVVKDAVPDIHVHGFSPLEVMHGAQTLGLSLDAYLQRLKAAGLASLPGTAAEILDDEVRRVICPDKLTTTEWLEVMRTAHGIGLRSTATIMFGHVDRPRHWARHLLRLRRLQMETGGFTEFVPLPFVHMEAPMYRKGEARAGPTFREALLMHAVARLVLHPYFRNIQTSWTKMGRSGAAIALTAGANDLGGVLMSESITRAAGGLNGQSFESADMAALAESIGRPLRQRNTLYGLGAPSPPADVAVTSGRALSRRYALR